MSATLPLRVRLGRTLRAAEATAWLFLAWLAIDILPGKLYRKLMPAMPFADISASVPMVLTLHQQIKGDQLARAIQTATQAVPFRAVCFHRGIAAYAMLRWRKLPCLLHYGVAKDSSGLKSHVWVTSGSKTVVGGEESPHFTLLATFGARNTPLRSSESR
jgi:Transglutaminase-like superfamily